MTHWTSNKMQHFFLCCRSTAGHPREVGDHFTHLRTWWHKKGNQRRYRVSRISELPGQFFTILLQNLIWVDFHWKNQFPVWNDVATVEKWGNNGLVFSLLPSAWKWRTGLRGNGFRCRCPALRFPRDGLRPKLRYGFTRPQRHHAEHIQQLEGAAN